MIQKGTLVDWSHLIGVRQPWFAKVQVEALEPYLDLKEELSQFRIGNSLRKEAF